MKRSRASQDDDDGNDENRTLTTRPRRGEGHSDVKHIAQSASAGTEGSIVPRLSVAGSEIAASSAHVAEEGGDAPTNQPTGHLSQKTPPENLKSTIQHPATTLTSTTLTSELPAMSTIPNATTPPLKPEPAEWGFVIYRTTYDNDTEWATFKSKLWESVEMQREGIEEAGAKFEGVTFDFVDDRPELHGVGIGRLRR